MPTISRCITTTSWIIWIGMAPLIIASVSIAQTSRPADVRQANEARLREVFRLAPIFLTGTVLDDKGEPVSGARIEFTLRSAERVGGGFKGKDERVERVTGANGRFELKDIMGQTVMVHAVSKDGYEFTHDKNPDTRREFTNPMGLKNPKDPSLPMILRVRKKLVGTFTHMVSPSFMFHPGDDKAKCVSFFYRPGCTKECDIEVTATYSKTGGECALTIKVPSKSGGLLRSGEKLWESPVAGYTESIVINLPLESPGPEGWVYVKSRQRPIYTRLRFAAWARRDAGSLSLDGESNPYGERNFEIASGFTDNPAVYEQLDNEAVKAFCEGRQPDKPDLDALFRAARQKKQTARSRPSVHP